MRFNDYKYALEADKLEWVSSIQMQTGLNYFGGKAKIGQYLFNQIFNLIVEMDKQGKKPKIFLDCFTGGGKIGLSMPWFDDDDAIIVMNDYNWGIYNFYYYCKNDYVSLIKMIDKIGLIMSEELFECALALRSDERTDGLTAAALTFWVTYSSFNGITSEKFASYALPFKVDLVDEFIVWMRSPEAKVNKTNKRSYSEATVKDTFTFLKGLLQYAVTRGYIIYNPCNMVQAPAVVEKEVEYLDDVQIANMLRALDDETENAWKEAEIKRKRGTIQEFTIQKDLIGALGKQLLVYIALNTAARRGEILALTRDDIDHEEKSIFFCKEVLYTRDNGTYLQHSLKTDKNKKVFISDTLLEMIDKYIVELDKLIQASNGKIPPTNMLFMSLRNTKTETVGGLPFPDPYSGWFKLFMKRNNLPNVSFHKLRHSSISYMINNGVDLFVVAQIAGHSSIEQIKKTYGHVWDKTKKEAANTLGKMFETNK